MIAAGAGLGHYTTEGGYLFPNAKVVRIDTQPKGPWQGLRAADLHVRADARAAAEAITVPASHFFEFTGTKSPKRTWKFAKAGEDWLCFAGLWRPMPDGAGDSFTILTTAPRPDIAPIHGST